MPADTTNQAKKSMAAGALLFNSVGEFIIVEMTYKKDWSIPGGVVETGESPLEGCRREVFEEVGLALPAFKLLVVDYKPAFERPPDWLHFTFDGGLLTDEQIQSIILQEGEIKDYRFVTLKEALPLVSTSMARRLPYCLQAREAGAAMYLEQGNIV